MKKKTFKAAPSKINKIEQFYAHFGWKEEYRDPEKLILVFDKRQRNHSILKKLQKQASIITSKFPRKMIGWAITSALFLVLYFNLNEGVLFNAVDLGSLLSVIPLSWIVTAIVNFLPILFVVIGGINGAFALYQLLVFIILKCTRNKTLEEIYRVADALSGNVIDAPLTPNIAPDGPDSGVLAAVSLKQLKN